jgi:hypothetical protein
MKTTFDGLDLDEQPQLPHEDLRKRSIIRYNYATKMSFEYPKLFSKSIKNKIYQVWPEKKYFAKLTFG